MPREVLYPFHTSDGTVNEGFQVEISHTTPLTKNVTWMRYGGHNVQGNNQIILHCDSVCLDCHYIILNGCDSDDDNPSGWFSCGFHSKGEISHRVRSASATVCPDFTVDTTTASIISAQN